MKLIALASSAAVAAASIDVDDGSIEITARFQAWNELHGKNFALDSDEFAGWKENDAIIQKTNAKGLSYTLGHNEYSYLKRQDFADMLTMKMPKSLLRTNNDKVDYSLGDPERVAAAADSVDWTTKGAVTPIKNQAQCGSCWAFSTTGSIEGAYQIAGNPLTAFSEQELVSCDMVDNGCQGGLMDNGFKYAETHALCTEDAYPYTSGTGIRGECKRSCTGVVEVGAFTDVESNNEEALATAVSQQPVSVAIEADKSVFQLYKSGIMDSKMCGTKLDHGVLAVGYGSDGGKDYWKVKNSWGESWGDQGYIRLGRGDNICGISQQPSFPTGVHPAGPTPPGPTPPGPSPSPPPPSGNTHYEDPNTTGSCMSDEVDIQITGITGSVCSPKCTGIFKTKCPKDVPAGVTAEPECALSDSSSGEKYCALICSPSVDEASLRAGDAQCSTNASCKAVPNASVGICTYDS